MHSYSRENLQSEWYQANEITRTSFFGQIREKCQKKKTNGSRKITFPRPYLFRICNDENFSCTIFLKVKTYIYTLLHNERKCILRLVRFILEIIFHFKY